MPIRAEADALRPATRPTHAAFVPRSRQIAYLIALFEALTNGQKPTDEFLSGQVGCKRGTIGVWRKDPAFVEWVRVGLRGEVGSRWAMVLAVAFRCAMDGSIEHMRFLRDIFEPAELPAMASGDQIVFNIPRPARELEGRTVVMGAVVTEAVHDTRPILRGE